MRANKQSEKVLGMVLAGGGGNRLVPLTSERAKPAVPFGGQYRLIDFVLSNLVNAGLRRIVVLTQYLSHSLDRHLAADLAAVAAAGQLRRHRAGADAHRPTLVRRARPTPSSRTSTSSATSSPTTWSSSAPTTSTAWTSRRCSSSTSRPAPASRWPAFRCRSTRPASSASSTPTTTARSARFSRSRPTRRRCPATRSTPSPRWATTSSPPTCCARW